VLSGTEAEFTADDLRQHAKITGFDERPDVIDNFFDVIRELTSSQQTLFVKFPIGGFGQLKNRVENLKRGSDVDDESLPVGFDMSLNLEASAVLVQRHNTAEVVHRNPRRQ
jgi:hypothetical protein